MSAGSAKQKVLEVIEKLPADATLEDAIERLVLLAKSESTREIIHGNYRIVCRLRRDVVEIVPCFMVLACSAPTDNDDIRASNFPMNPPAASRCSAAAGDPERYPNWVVT